jgi:threonine/homoserine/homoserine lactone efflux protein
MEFLKYKMVKLLLVALVLALVAFPFDEMGFVFMALRLISFAIIMYVIIKLLSGKKNLKKN